jgi:hypothetical protein
MADELLRYTAMRQGTTVNYQREVRGGNAVDSIVSMPPIRRKLNNDPPIEPRSESRGN